MNTTESGANQPEGETVVTVNRTNRARNRKYLWYLIPAVLLLAALAIVLFVTFAPKRVVAVEATPVRVTRTVTASGEVSGAREADIGADIAGVVEQLNAREGDLVEQGDLLLTLESEELDARVNQAEQALQTARAQLSQVLAGASDEEIAQARSELARARQVGQARVAAAEAELRDLQQGARQTEIARAQAEVRRLRALVAQEEADVERARQLVGEGAIAAVELERAQTALRAAQENLRSAEEQLNELQQGARPEVIAQARAQLEAARADYRTSVQAAEARVQQLLSQPRPEEVQVAQERVKEAEAALDAAIAQRARANVNAPFDGIVTELFVEEGQPISPAQPALRLVEIAVPEIIVDLDENYLSDVEVGQEAVVTSQAFPGRRINATVSKISPRVDPEQGTVEVTLIPERTPEWLRSNLTVDASIVIASNVREILVPPSSVTRIGGEAYVMVIENGEAVRRKVETGGTNPQGVVILSGLREGELIVRDADEVMSGDRVIVVRRVTNGQV